MKLGNAVQLIINAENLEQSVRFYEDLGYSKIAEKKGDNQWAQVSDGQILILLNQDKMPYTGLAYYSDDIQARVAKLEEAGIEFEAKINKENDLYIAVINEPNGLTISLMNYDSSKIFKPGGQPASKCGNFGEISIETSDLNSSVAFWNKLGFETAHRSEGFVTLKDGLMTVGIYGPGVCNHKFRNPSITYFEPDMAERIEKLKLAGKTFAQELPNAEGIVSEAILESPEGTYLFLFN
jgi:predicted enzyme related to lactoylglutathione lyase